MATAAQRERLGRRLRTARDKTDAVYEECRLAALEASVDGVSETQLARELGVDRMTIRKWQGKR